jgi:hypothetical protein
MAMLVLRGCAIGLALLLYTLGVVHAVPLVWTYHDASFADGGTLSGWFVFDADDPDFIFPRSFDILLNGGTSGIPSFEFTPATVDDPILTGISDTFMAVENHSNRVNDVVFVISTFSQAMTDAGGKIPIELDAANSFSLSYKGFDATPFGDSTRSQIIGGYISASPVPEPSGGILIALGSIALALSSMRRKKKRSDRACLQFGTQNSPFSRQHPLT